ncbi:hypothetical protein HYW83_02085 [Candidatus Peregrinibacteria bacterium]|nr:hypothetical protein [Candidatus Peregrinibacteria bacterium]
MARERIDYARLEEVMAQDTSGACGIAGIQSAIGATREVVEIALASLCANDVRGGKTREKKGKPTGDGAGLMLRTDSDGAGRGMQTFLHAKVGREVPLTIPGEQLHGSIFFIDAGQRANTEMIGDKVAAILAQQGLAPLAWKTVPTDPDAVSARARAIQPLSYYLVYGEGDVARSDLKRALFDARLRVQSELSGTHPVSLQPGTMVWKAMCRGEDLPEYYPDLRDESVVSDAALTHTRFGTNVLAHWLLAQPFDLLGHNGEVNNIRIINEINHALERRLGLSSSNIMKGGSDSANLDRMLQLLHCRAGLSLPEAVRFLMHPAPDDLANMDPEVQMYFQAVARVLGPLRAVGPIALLTMDRDHVVASLDNMGLRPLRWVQRDDGLTVLSSEIGSPHIEPARIVDYGRAGPGQFVILDKSGRMLGSDAANHHVVAVTKLNFHDFADRETSPLQLNAGDSLREAQIRESFSPDAKTRISRAHLFGLNKQRIQTLKETIEAKKDPIEGMGSDLALPIFSDEPHSLAQYFRPDYSQVTNPSLDPIRNKGAFSIKTRLGRKPKSIQLAKRYEARAQLSLNDPLLDDEQMLALYAKPEKERPKVLTLSTVFERDGMSGFKDALSRITSQVRECAQQKTNSVIVLSDRDIDRNPGSAYLPPHLAVSHLRKMLIDEGLIEFVSLVVDTGEVWNQHEYAMLVACGADAVHPRMIYEYMRAGELGKIDGDNSEKLRSGLREGFNFTLLRYMSKLGITDVEQYRGGRQFSTLNLDTAFVNRYFGDIGTNGSGVGLERILEDQTRRAAFDGRSLRPEDEKHGYAKAVWSALQEVGEPGKYGSPEEAYRAYCAILEKQGPLGFRDLLRFKTADGKKRKPIPIDKVMSKEEIIRRILRGASMSLGALNEKSHMAVNLLFNKYSSRASSGEGGVSPKTRIGEPWEEATSKERQIASGRFAADVEYLADPRVEWIEIKIGQGAKPGVGGHLPGEKVMELVAEVRGVGLGQDLISPPTNHNIYSIEDLEAFIQHLRAVNPAAKVSVKITSGANVGNIGVGCVKAGAHKVQVSGDQGGTGAATFTDKFNTGNPAELGAASLDRALIERGMRDGVVLGADGGMRTGADVLKMIMLGCNEVALGTAILIAQQKCVFCSSCSFQTCPSDICRTRSEFLGSKKGRERKAIPPDAQMEKLLKAGSHFLELMADEIRGYMAEMGVADIDELIGRRDLLEIDPRHEPLAKHFEMGKMFLDTPNPIFESAAAVPKPLRRLIDRVKEKVERIKHPTKYDPRHIDFYVNHDAVNEANRAVIKEVADAWARGDKTARIDLNLTTASRSLGATLAGLKVKKVVEFPEQGVVINTSGEAGQGYAFAITDGMTMRHRGVVQNETAEIQNGGRVVVMPPNQPQFSFRNDLPLVGNTLRYGARGGEAFVQGSIGDRGCIRETAGRTIISGNTGKYFAEYKTGGRDVVLGKFWGEVGPGMSGGQIYARDRDIEQKLSSDAMVTRVSRSRDRAVILQDLKDFYAETQDRETGEILENWETEQYRFQKVVAKGQYSTGVFQYLYKRLSGQRDEEKHEDLLADLFEMCGYDIDVDTGRFTYLDMNQALNGGLEELRIALARKASDKKRPLDPEEVFIFTRGFATQMTEQIKAQFLRP